MKRTPPPGQLLTCAILCVLVASCSASPDGAVPLQPQLRESSELRFTIAWDKEYFEAVEPEMKIEIDYPKTDEHLAVKDYYHTLPDGSNPQVLQVHVCDPPEGEYLARVIVGQKIVGQFRFAVDSAGNAQPSQFGLDVTAQVHRNAPGHPLREDDIDLLAAFASAEGDDRFHIWLLLNSVRDPESGMYVGQLMISDDSTRFQRATRVFARYLGKEIGLELASFRRDVRDILRKRARETAVPGDGEEY